MRFMNSAEIEDAAARFKDHALLGPATQTLLNLMEWTNDNSDGWPYWTKPTRAANKLMEIIERDGTWQWRNRYRDDVTAAAEIRKAYSPIKAFRTKQEADFIILEVK